MRKNNHAARAARRAFEEQLRAVINEIIK